MEQKRVVITGLGAVTPLGNTVQQTWEAAKNGISGINTITQFDTSECPVTIAGEVKDFDFSAYGIEPRVKRKMARFSKFLLAATIQAVADCGYTKDELAQETKAGIVVGNCLGGQDAVEDGFARYFNPNIGPQKMSPLTTPMMITNEAAAHVSMYFGLHGISWTLGTACASGTDALGLAAELIRSGRLNVCISGGTESTVNGFSLSSYYALQALSYHYNDTPQKASRPFDRDRDGFVVGEGSTVLILEEREHALKRGAHIYAELAGFGSTTDAYHITAPRKDGSIAAKAVKEALEDAGMQPQDIQYYNAHGTATVANDSAETNMLHTVFKEHASKLHISSTKSMTGHLIGAAGALEALFCVKAITDSFIPPTINLDNPDRENGCDLDYTPLVGISTDVQAAASASLGFGGHNSCIIIKKHS
ncbi:MAG: beta-ketoacyl-ACP synthase II [Treponema sp.]|nr:beta-ketoacyl-ACP synthase II [Treponema sp.]